MPYTVLGLPTHALLIHATVVLIPATTLLLLLCAFSGRLRARAGLLLPLAGISSLILVPLSTSSGQKLQDHLPVSPAIQAHAHAAQGLLPWAIGLAVMTIAVYLADRFGPQVAQRSTGAGPSRRRIRQPQSVGAAALSQATGTLDPRSRLSVAIAVLATAAAVGAAAQVAYIGHLGAEAAWSYAKNLPARGAG